MCYFHGVLFMISFSLHTDGIYVRVNGRLKIFKGSKQLVAFSVRPVTNFDELTFHFVECIHFQVQNSRTKQGDATTQSHSVTPSTNTVLRDGSNGYQSTLPNHFSGQFSVEGLKGFDLQQPSNFGWEKGVHRDELSQKLKLPMEKIIESIRTLEEEGLIYKQDISHLYQNLFPSIGMHSCYARRGT
ncbi:replication protein A 32 kDa subunit A-like [Rhododendron vialii]|uniref:replication protein A 32 kDa subunit A-like n=1 Tax=Rhododendron vialii TaxID=182163 RepID=UPI00265F2697|nr:replication protein A 32 kDa subunit A-like [Rhododendron vialii]